LITIAFCYAGALLLVERSRALQLSVLVLVLVFYWAAFALYPLPPARFDFSEVGVTPGLETYAGFFGHWSKNTNVAAALDVWLLNLFPRDAPFVFNSHGYQTLTIVTSFCSTLIGLIVGQYLLEQRSREQSRNVLLASGAALIVIGLLMASFVCPLVKSIGTPSWVIFSSGCIILALGAIFHLTEVRGHTRWAFPLVVVGTNAILLYTLAIAYRYWILLPFDVATDGRLFEGVYGPLVQAATCGLVLWLLAFLLYRARIFVRL
jgi:heparan-alpha-glucosaminide N-acetyltransferase